MGFFYAIIGISVCFCNLEPKSSKLPTFHISHNWARKRGLLTGNLLTSASPDKEVSINQSVLIGSDRSHVLCNA